MADIQTISQDDIDVLVAYEHLLTMTVKIEVMKEEHVKKLMNRIRNSNNESSYKIMMMAFVDEVWKNFNDE